MTIPVVQLQGGDLGEGILAAVLRPVLAEGKAGAHRVLGGVSPLVAFHQETLQVELIAGGHYEVVQEPQDYLVLRDVDEAHLALHEDLIHDGR